MSARAEPYAAAQYSDICRPDQKKLGTERMVAES